MRRLLILAVVVFAAMYAQADPIEFTFLAWNDGDWQNGYPYFLQQTNGPPNAVQAVMCDDYIHAGMPGDMWEANVTDLGPGNISKTRFNTTPGANALYPLLLYNEAGWLLLETQVEPTSEFLPINSAVWNIFDPAAPCNTECMAWLAAAQNEARIGFPGVDFYKVYIITPVNQHDPDPNDIQEFMYIGEDTRGGGADGAQTVPEPGTLLLMGTGLMAAFGRRFLR